MAATMIYEPFALYGAWLDARYNGDAPELDVILEEYTAMGSLEEIVKTIKEAGLDLSKIEMIEMDDDPGPPLLLEVFPDSLTDLQDKVGRYHPFSNGSQFMDWQESNCCRCKKYNVQEDIGLEREGDCTIMDALGLASISDGSVSEGVARRMGYLEGVEKTERYIWMCNEVEWDDTWMLEVARKAGFETVEVYQEKM